MPLPSFLGPLVPLPLPAAPLLRFAGPIGGAAASANLNLSVEAQMGNNWCWAATSKSVSAFFDPASPWTQCGIAAACLGGQCCVAPAPCDVPFALEIALAVTGNLQGAPQQGSDSRANVQGEIDGGRPVCCHIAWSADSGHFVAISGYDWNTDDVFVEDPLYGSQTVPYAGFVSAYRGSGSWDYTYLTQQ